MIAKTANVQDISPYKEAMIQTMVNNARAKGWSEDKIEDNKYHWNVLVDDTIENIRNALEREGR